MPAALAITNILSLITGATVALPRVIEAIKSAKELVSFLSASKQITAEEQNALNDYIEGIEWMIEVGLRPAHWTVEPDPTTGTIP